MESTNLPVKIEVEIVHGRPISTLIRASESAGIVCVGSVGFKRFGHGHLGSVTAALANAAPSAVAIIRPRDNSADRRGTGAITVEMDDSPGNAGLLKVAVEEAVLRRAPIRAVTCWQPGPLDGQAVADRNHQVRAQGYRRLAQWKRRYPDLTIHSVTNRGPMSEYLAGDGGRHVQLAVVRRGEPGIGGKLIGATGDSALRNTHCSLFIAKHRDG